MESQRDNPFDRVVGPWERVMEDVAATADRYRADGRTVVELHPGDVAVLTGDPETTTEQQGTVDPASRRLGFDVVVPGDEFERLQSALADRTVDECEVFRATGDGMVFLLVALESEDDLAVLLPAYYSLDERAALESVARQHGLQAHVRPLSDDAVVTVDIENPDPFFAE
jgi:hypothetical protein